VQDLAKHWKAVIRQNTDYAEGLSSYFIKTVVLME